MHTYSTSSQTICIYYKANFLKLTTWKYTSKSPPLSFGDLGLLIIDNTGTDFDVNMSLRSYRRSWKLSIYF